MKKNKKTVKLSVRLSEEDAAKLKARAEKQDTGITSIARAAIREYLAKVGK